MALRAIAVMAMLGFFAATTPIVGTAYTDPYFDNFMESGIKNVYTLFEIQNVENSEKFYKYMVKHYKNSPCDDAFECHEQGIKNCQTICRVHENKIRAYIYLIY
ncbi:lysis inhibition regulator [Shigella phage SSE1]|uniref:Lysis inhibition regulator n=1 Tax=Shigella phage SSE1 TaxID=2562131 RepID=A0A4D6DXN9_9CAUD|nr:lysis inhibition regulator [Shigella phage SSE1]